MIQLIYYSFLIGSILQILYWLFFSRLIFFKPRKVRSNATFPPVSVVICAKNEAVNLQSYLPTILNQDYPDFEVLVVDDASTDDTAAVLQAFQKKHKHLRILSLSGGKRTIKGKKYALSKGIEAAKYPTLLLTDADCAPASLHWISEMQAHLHHQKTIGIGYAPMFKHGGWLNALTRIETTYTAIQYFAFALWGLPYMGVGRNIIYKKKVFEAANGFEKHQHIASGDDDLFVREAANKRNINIILSPKTFMYSEPEKDFKHFYRQKGRHLSTSVHYHWWHKILLGLYPVSLFALHFYLPFMIFLEISVRLAIFLYLTRLIVFWTINYFIFKRLKVFDLWRALPLLDLLYLTYLVGMIPTLIFRKTDRWM